MKLTSQTQRRAAALQVPDDGFEELRASFYLRLKSERLRLLNLGAALVHGDVSRPPVLDELRSRAHRLCGTAAIFELTVVAGLARDLELAVDGATIAAAGGAPTPQEENSDTVMCAALHALARGIGSLGKASRAPRACGLGTVPRRGRPLLNG
jgi:hypothetical protein